MPIDFNKPIGAPAAASTALPSKTTMNLLVRERASRGAWKYVVAALVLAALVALFTKFAVLDVFKQTDLKQAELYAAQQELAAVDQQLENYDAVLEEYRSYTGISSSGSLDALQVMDMVGSVVQPRATVTAASTADGVLVVNVKGITLDELGRLTDTLRAQPMVNEVSVTTATDTGDASETAAQTGEEAAQTAGTSSASEDAQDENNEDASSTKQANTVSATIQIMLAVEAEEGGE